MYQVNIKPPKKQLKTIHSWKAALSKLIFLHISNVLLFLARNMVKPSDYLYLNKDIDSATFFENIRARCRTKLRNILC